VAGFARIAAPLSDLLIEADADLRKKKFRPMRWTPFAEYSFLKLKDPLMEEPIIIQPDRSKPFRIETDASEWAVGAVLLQEGPYDGRKLTKAELNYPVHEKELLAIKEALRTWNEYISNSTTTTIVTDHESLQYLYYQDAFETACSLG
jgi:RNase H-like domain found in reverse transcriptase